MPTKKQMHLIWESELEYPETRRTDDPMYRQPKGGNNISDDIFKVGDRVKRKNGYQVCGEVVEVSDISCKIKWDEIASNGQQHSTIQFKFLVKVVS